MVSPKTSEQNKTEKKLKINRYIQKQEKSPSCSGSVLKIASFLVI